MAGVGRARRVRQVCAGSGARLRQAWAQEERLAGSGSDKTEVHAAAQLDFRRAETYPDMTKRSQLPSGDPRVKFSGCVHV